MRNLFKKLSLIFAIVVTSITLAFSQGDPVTYRTRSADGFMQVDHYLSVARRLGIPTGATETLDADASTIKTGQVFLFYNTTTKKLRVFDRTSNTWVDATPIKLDPLGDGNFVVGNGTGANAIRKIQLSDIQPLLNTRFGIGSTNSSLLPTETLDLENVENKNYITWSNSGSTNKPLGATSGVGGVYKHTSLLSGAVTHYFKTFQQPTLDNFFYMGGSSTNAGTWRQVASREWVNAQPYSNITSQDKANWNTAFGYGQGIPTSSTRGVSLGGEIIDLNTAPKLAYATALSASSPNYPSNVVGQPGGFLSLFSGTTGFQLIGDRAGNNLGFRTGRGSEYGDWRKIWHDGNLTQASVDNFNTAYGWGNHAGKYLSLTGDESYSGVKTKVGVNDLKYVPAGANSYRLLENVAGVVNMTATPMTSLQINLGQHMQAIMWDLDVEINKYVANNGLARYDSRSGRIKITFYNSVAGTGNLSMSASVIYGNEGMITSVDYYRNSSNHIIVKINGNLGSYSKANASITVYHNVTDAQALSLAKSITMVHSDNVTDLTRVATLTAQNISYGLDSQNAGAYGAVVSDPDISGLTTPKNVDLNTIKAGNYLMTAGAGSQNAPGSEKAFSVLGMSGGSLGVGAQFAIASSGNSYTTDPIWFRERQNLPWKKIWSSQDFQTTNITNWNTSYAWGNYATHGLGTGLQGNPAVTTDVFSKNSTGFFRYAVSSANTPSNTNGTYINMYRSSGMIQVFALDDFNNFFIGTKSGGVGTAPTWTQMAPLDSTAFVSYANKGTIARQHASVNPTLRYGVGENAWDFSNIVTGSGATGKSFGSNGKGSVTFGENNLSYGSYGFTGGINNKNFGSYTAMFGTNNTSEGLQGGIIGGSTNDVRSNSNNSVVGGNNNIVNASGSFVSGERNNLNAGANSSLLVGTDNVLNNGSAQSIVGGQSNIVTNSASNNIVSGQSNILTNGSTGNIVSGGGNSIQDTLARISQNNIISGYTNTIKGTIYSSVLGIDNFSRVNNSTIISGQGNQVYDIGSSIVSGTSNKVNSGIGNLVVGIQNIVDANDSQAIVNGSIVGGVGNISRNPAQIIGGIYNADSPNLINTPDLTNIKGLVIGGGSDENNRKDAVYITLGGTIVTNGGDVIITDPTKGVIFTAPDGSRWRQTINNSGVLQTTKLP